jgi:hypothetical protein
MKTLKSERRVALAGWNSWKYFILSPDIPSNGEVPYKY